MRLAGFTLALLLVTVPLLAHSPAADSYVLRLDDITYMNGKGMSGEMLKQLQSTYGKRFFWFRRGGKTYVVKSSGELERAEAIVQPQSELGRKQAALGTRQAALGSQQAQLGAKQAELGAQQARSARDDHAQAELSRQQEALGKKQDEMGKVQGDLGREQSKLGAMQDRISRQVEQQLANLADQCIRSGEAKEVSR